MEKYSHSDETECALLRVLHVAVLRDGLQGKYFHGNPSEFHTGILRLRTSPLRRMTDTAPQREYSRAMRTAANRKRRHKKNRPRCVNESERK
jgi:hypothetical protein